MQSFAIQPCIGACGHFKTSTSKTPFKNSLSALPNAFYFQSQALSHLKFSCQSTRNTELSASSAAAVEAVAEETAAAEEEKEKLGVVVKPMQRPRIVLKFIWMEKNIGVALDQVIPGHGTIPVGPYYFCPRKDAWEELKVMLEDKPWISQKQMIILLNQATDIINLWQQRDTGSGSGEDVL